ncbi:MAG: Gfo/Idh/MocA family oxidoreductase [Aggregatilineales bacterium]
MKMYRVAIVGAGNIANTHIATIKAHSDRAELVAMVDLDEARVCSLCEANNIPKWYTDIGDMLTQEQPDLVHIITPHSTHKTLSIQCLEAGAWVYCEKPLCGSLADFDEITAAEQRTGRYVSTVFQWRFGSAGKHIKKLVQTNALGKPMVGVCNTLWYRTQDYYDVPWRGKFATEFGGPTLTLGIHLMDLYLWLMGDWQEIRAMVGTLDRDIEVEDVSMAMVRFQNGMMGSVINSALSPHQESYLRLDFQKATLECSTLYRYTNEHWTFNQPANVDDPEIAAHWSALTEDYQGSHSQQLGELIESMDRNERPLVSGAEARRIIEFISSLYKSAFTGLPVQQGEITSDDPYYYANNGQSEMVSSS